MNYLASVSSILIVVALFSRCFGGGTHGFIKAYTFPVAKKTLQNAVFDVLLKNDSLRISPITDTLTGKYYNDGDRYITMEIGSEVKYYEYTFQFPGKKQYWDTAQSSEISIAYAYDEDGKGGSMGNGGFSDCKKDVRERIIDRFEKMFIVKLDSIIELRK